MMLDTNTSLLSDGEHSILLFRTQLSVMLVLARSGAQMTVPHRILMGLFGDGANPVMAMKVCIWRMRRRLGGAGIHGLILTTWGIGFRLSELVDVAGAACPAIIQADRVAALRALLWSHPDHAAAERFLVELGV